MAAILGCCFRVSFRRSLKASRAPISVTTRLGHVQVQRDLLGASLSVMLNIGYIMPRSGNYFRKAYASSHGVPGHRSDENTHPVFHSSATISQRKAAGSFGGDHRAALARIPGLLGRSPAPTSRCQAGRLPAGPRIRSFHHPQGSLTFDCPWTLKPCSLQH